MERKNEEHRHSYMLAKATLEHSIPRAIMEEMRKQGYDVFGFEGQYRDLCSLIVVVSTFMTDVVKVRDPSSPVVID